MAYPMPAAPALTPRLGLSPSAPDTNFDTSGVNFVPQPSLSLNASATAGLSPSAPVSAPTNTVPQEQQNKNAWIIPLITTLIGAKFKQPLLGFAVGAQGAAAQAQGIEKRNEDAQKEAQAKQAQDRADQQAKSLEDSRKAEVLNKALDQIEQGGTDSALAFIKVAPGFTDAERKEMADSVSSIAPMKLKILKDRTDARTKVDLDKANKTYDQEMQKEFGTKFNLNRTYDASGELHIETVAKTYKELSPTDQADIDSKRALIALHEGQAGKLSSMSDRELLIRIEDTQKSLLYAPDDPTIKDRLDALNQEARSPSRHIYKAAPPAASGVQGAVGSGYDPTKSFRPDYLTPSATTNTTGMSPTNPPATPQPAVQQAQAQAQPVATQTAPTATGTVGGLSPGPGGTAPAGIPAPSGAQKTVTPEKEEKDLVARLTSKTRMHEFDINEAVVRAIAEGKAKNRLEALRLIASIQAPL